MDGVFGLARFDAPLSAEAVSALARTADADAPAAAWGPGLAVRARGWARSRRLDHIWIAGDAHLVGDGSSGTDGLDRVAAAYASAGVEGLGRLRGRFCVALYDVPRHRLVLATDHFATRPLYYCTSEGTLAFASRLSRLAPHHDATIDRQAILELLFYGTIPAPRTPFRKVAKVPAAHALIAEPGATRLVPYWDVSYAEGNGARPDWPAMLRAQIEETIRAHAMCEAPGASVGAFLSGGTDSSTIAGMLTAVLARPVDTFSIGYSEEGYDELYFARAASTWFGTVPHERRLDADEALRLLPGVVDFYDDPLANASALPTLACAALARAHGVTVLFAGDGGDELFAGNSRYAADKVFALYQRLPAPLRARVTDRLARRFPEQLPLLGKARRYVRRSNLPNPRRMLSYNLLLEEPPAALLHPEFLATVDVDRLLARAEEHFDRPPAGTTELNRLLYVDLKMAIADNDVRKVSGMAELAGVEVRYPFLDPALAEFAAHIPSALKLRGFDKRHVFKRALADFLPPTVLGKAKHGFGAPVATWMRQSRPWQAFIGDLVHDSRTRQRGYLQPAALDRLWQQQTDDHTSFYGDSLWTIVMLELWHRRHVDGGAGRS